MLITKLIHDWMSPVLSDRTILKYNEKGLLITDPLDPVQVQPNSVDLTVASSCKYIVPNATVHGQPAVDIGKRIDYASGAVGQPKRIDGIWKDRPYFYIGPQQFILLASNEILNIPNGIIAFVQGRSSIARLGIQTEQAGLIDAGFNGTITFEVYNQTEYPIIIYEGTRIAQVYFFKAQYANRLYGTEDMSSKYSGQIEATGSRINSDPEMTQKN